jgi:hypothetical protein
MTSQEAPSSSIASHGITAGARQPPPPLDDMVDGTGGIRTHWSGRPGALAGPGRDGLATRAALLDRHVIEEGATSLLPGGSASAAYSGVRSELNADRP